MSSVAVAPSQAARGSRFAVWWTILRICIEERLVYRGDFALGTLMRFMPIITQTFLWTAVFVGAGGPNEIGDYSRNDFVAYYLLTYVARAFSSMPGLANSIAAQVRTGEIKKYLVQPIDMLAFLFLSRMAHKLVYYAVATGPFVFVFYICRGFFPGWPDLATFGAFVLSLLMAFVLGFFLEATLGMIGFWFLEVSSILFVYMLFNFFFSGHMFPLTLLPEWAEPIVMAQPLQYLAYFPAAVFLGKVQGDALVSGLLVEAAWIVFFIVASRTAFALGVRRYSAFGG
ncbi:MAG: ABC-2 family transporter protein [Planctomycetaceae bacterium]|nr:ABC-2 family transporter protein [Planctomycetaceae bacterium]